MNWMDFLAMGGYGFYVWTSYALAAVALLLNLVVPLKRRKTVRRQLAELNRVREEH